MLSSGDIVALSALTELLFRPKASGRERQNKRGWGGGWTAIIRYTPFVFPVTRGLCASSFRSGEKSVAYFVAPWCVIKAKVSRGKWQHAVPVPVSVSVSVSVPLSVSVSVSVLVSISVQFFQCKSDVVIKLLGMISSCCCCCCWSSDNVAIQCIGVCVCLLLLLV